MLSTCPSCLNQILHDDGVSQLNCECGEKFSPFLEMAATAPDERLSVAPPFSVENDVSAGVPTFADYSESEAAFAELRNFGEGLGNEVLSDSEQKNPPPEQLQKNQVPPSMPLAEATPIPAAPSSLSTCDTMISAGDTISGYQIDVFLNPISIWSHSALESEDPLQQAYKNLSEKAQKAGANGVISVRWSFTPDGSRILLTGTPVKCRKIG
ncbi:MAG: hypothetical protein ACKOA8_00880 [Deltaproteobacteria bacterium]